MLRKMNELRKFQYTIYRDRGGKNNSPLPKDERRPPNTSLSFNLVLKPFLFPFRRVRSHLSARWSSTISPWIPRWDSLYQHLQGSNLLHKTVLCRFVNSKLDPTATTWRKWSSTSASWVTLTPPGIKYQRTKREIFYFWNVEKFIWLKPRPEV